MVIGLCGHNVKPLMVCVHANFNSVLLLSKLSFTVLTTCTFKDFPVISTILTGASVLLALVEIYVLHLPVARSL